jgi:uncharacterized membrane protein
MPAKKPYKVDIDVIPYLSIMAIVLKLICLILIVMVMRIAINPDKLKVIRYTQLYQPPEEANTASNALGVVEKQISKEPVYLDCHPDHVEIQPDGVIVPEMELRNPQGEFVEIIHRLDTNRLNQFGIVIARPGAASVYRYVRRQLASRKLTVGYDVLEADVIINWAKAIGDLQVRLKDLEKANADEAAAKKAQADIKAAEKKEK